LRSEPVQPYEPLTTLQSGFLSPMVNNLARFELMT
jgi:hypothetical protein